MTHSSHTAVAFLNRRVALASAGAAAVGLTGLRPARAHDDDLAAHPLAGTWLAMANPPLPDDPQFPATSLFASDGTVLLVFPASQTGPQGPFLSSAALGLWEAETDQRGSFTAVQIMSAPDGTLLGSVTIEGHPEVSADGQTFIDDGSLATITMRDASGAIINQIVPTGSPQGRPVTAVRMAVGVSGFPESPATDATPTS
ncbi:MAG: hypothetical protein U0Z70_14940 [Thermomicrobiales bacterium]